MISRKIVIVGGALCILIFFHEILTPLLLQSTSIPRKTIFHTYNLSTSPPTSTVSKLFRWQTCQYPLVYNKPPKTASSFIRGVIRDWARSTGRRHYYCSALPRVSNIVLHECIPSHNAGLCSVLNCHFYLDPNAQQLLNERMPNHRLITSTRDPTHRIFSNFLQWRHIKLQDDAANVTDVMQRFGLFLESYNPWFLYNYHTGENRNGSCPLRSSDKMAIIAMAARYHIVIDVNLRDISNAILKHHGLFQLPEREERPNERGAHLLKIPHGMKRTMKRAACVEKQLHEALMHRMASLYEHATGQKCIFDNYNCVEKMERKISKMKKVS